MATTGQVEERRCAECDHPERWHRMVTGLGHIAGPCNDVDCTCRRFR